MHLGPAVEHSARSNVPATACATKPSRSTPEHKPHSQAGWSIATASRSTSRIWASPGATGSSCCGLTEASEETLGNSRITDWLSPHFFRTNFWYMWQTTFAFQPWHSAVELKRYLHRFMNEFPRIETLAGVKRTVYNQYDAIVRPLAGWLKGQGVQFVRGTAVTDMAIESEDGRLRVRQLVLDPTAGIAIALEDGDLVFFKTAR